MRDVLPWSLTAVPTSGGCLGDLLLSRWQGGQGWTKRCRKRGNKAASFLGKAHEGVMVAWQGPWGREKGR